MASWLEQARAENAALPELVTGIQVAELREGIDTRLQRRRAARIFTISAAMMSVSLVCVAIGGWQPQAREPEATRTVTPTSQDSPVVSPLSVSPNLSPATGVERPVEPAPSTTATADARFELMAADERARALAIERMELNLKKPRDIVGELLAAADLARKEGRASDAATALQTVAQKHGRDPRAPSAAFSLGRVLLESQQRPADAAAAFALVAKLGPKSPLVEDALAREVEAWARAGDPAKAQAVARRYLERYPRGARAPAVRALAKLD